MNKLIRVLINIFLLIVITVSFVGCILIQRNADKVSGRDLDSIPKAKYRNNNYYYNEDEENDDGLTRAITGDVTAYDGEARNISFWGDSMTEGVGREIGGYVPFEDSYINITDLSTPDVVGFLTGINVYNMGSSGENSLEIATREGGIPMYLKNDVVILDKPVKVDFITEDENYVMMDDFNGYGGSSYMYESDIVYINGNRFKIIYDETGQTYITRFYGLDDNYSYLYKGLSLGEQMNMYKSSIYLKKGSIVKTAAAYEHKDDILVIEVGSNGGWDDYDDLIAQIDAMLLVNDTQYYIIVGDTDNPGESIAEWWESSVDELGRPRGLTNTEWENALEEAYGDHFLNTRLYMILHGLKDCGIEETAIDKEGYKYGKISDSLRYDWTHFNAFGYYSKAIAIYKKGVSLGYWQ